MLLRHGSKPEIKGNSIHSVKSIKVEGRQKPFATLRSIAVSKIPVVLGALKLRDDDNNDNNKAPPEPLLSSSPKHAIQSCTQATFIPNVNAIGENGNDAVLPASNPRQARR